MIVVLLALREVALEVEDVISLALASNAPPITPAVMARTKASSTRNFMVVEWRICGTFEGVRAEIVMRWWMKENEMRLMG